MKCYSDGVFTSSPMNASNTDSIIILNTNKQQSFSITSSTEGHIE